MPTNCATFRESEFMFIMLFHFCHNRPDAKGEPRLMAPGVAGGGGQEKKIGTYGENFFWVFDTHPHYFDYLQIIQTLIMVIWCIILNILNDRFNSPCQVNSAVN